MEPNNNQNNYEMQPSGLSVASFILGIVSIVLLCCGGFGIPLGALGIIFALLSRRGRHMNTQAKIGFGLSLGGIGLSLAFLIMNMIVLFSSGAISTYIDMMNRYDLSTEEGLEDFLEEWQDYLYEEQLPDTSTPDTQTPDTQVTTIPDNAI